MAGKLPGGAADGPGIDAAMSLEALILSVDQQGEVAPIDLRRLDGEAPATIGARVGAQEAIVAIENRDGEVVADLERCDRKRRPACRYGDEEGEQGEQEPQAPHGRAQTPWRPDPGACGLRFAARLAAGAESTTMPDGLQQGSNSCPPKERRIGVQREPSFMPCATRRANSRSAGPASARMGKTSSARARPRPSARPDSRRGRDRAVEAVPPVGGCAQVAWSSLSHWPPPAADRLRCGRSDPGDTCLPP